MPLLRNWIGMYHSLNKFSQKIVHFSDFLCAVRSVAKRAFLFIWANFSLSKALRTCLDFWALPNAPIKSQVVVHKRWCSFFKGFTFGSVEAVSQHYMTVGLCICLQNYFLFFPLKIYTRTTYWGGAFGMK